MVNVKGLIPVLFFSMTLVAPCQDPGSSAGQAHPDNAVGNYSVVITSLESTPATHLLNPELTIAVDAASRIDPKDANGTLSVPGQYAIESIGKPRYTCVQGPGRDHGCEAIDRCELTVRDANTLEYRVVNHGGAVQLKVNLLVHDVAPVSHPGERIVWHPHDVIFVSVPTSSPTYHFISAVLVGEWNHDAVVFEVGKPLPAAAKKALDDLGVHQNLGDRTLYSYRVREPEKSSEPAKAKH